MSDGTSSFSIPEDLPSCQALIEQLAQTVDSQCSTIRQLEQRSEEQELTIADLLQRAFARRSERYIHDPNQLVLDFGAEAQDAADGLAEAAQESGNKSSKHTPDAKTSVESLVAKNFPSICRVTKSLPTSKTAPPMANAK